MRYNNICLVLICLMIGFVSCQHEEGPLPVAASFLEAMQAHDYKKAGEYGTPETVKLLQQFEKIEKLNGTLPEEESGKITILYEEIKGKSATVFFTEEGDSLEQKISLVKVKGANRNEWKVDLKKEEIRLMQESGKKENAAGS